VKEGITGYRHGTGGRGDPRMYGRLGFPTVLVPAPFLLGAALFATFALGRKVGRRRFGNACGSFGSPRGTAGCGPRREPERPGVGEERVGT
jgi:hypothetical protein